MGEKLITVTFLSFGLSLFSHNTNNVYAQRRSEECWREFSHSDRYGNDIAQIGDSTLKSCKAHCISNNLCVSISFGDTFCWLKSGIADLDISNSVSTYDYLCRLRNGLNVTPPNDSDSQSPLRLLNILFYLPMEENRQHLISHQHLHTGSGFSGTETALLEVAQYLARRGHNITILLEQEHSFGTYITEGVTVVHTAYTIPIDYDTYLNYTDIFCPIDFLNYHTSQRLILKLDPQRVKLWVWFHTVMTLDWQLELIRGALNRTVLCSFVSHFVSDMYTYPIGRFCSISTVIGNAVAPYFSPSLRTDGFSSYVTESRKGRWVFHARYYRGGALALRVYSHVQKLLPSVANELHFLSYDTSDSSSESLSRSHSAASQRGDVSKGISRESGLGGVVSHGSLSKRGVALVLTNADYFVYPLADESGEMHHDTFATVVLEALSSGVLVVTWDSACLKDVYGDLIELVPIPFSPESHSPYYPSNKRGHSVWAASEEGVAALARAVLRLETRPKEKQRRREAGMLWAQTQNWTLVGALYAEWLEKSI